MLQWCAQCAAASMQYCKGSLSSAVSYSFPKVSGIDTEKVQKDWRRQTDPNGCPRVTARSSINTPKAPPSRRLTKEVFLRTVATNLLPGLSCTPPKGLRWRLRAQFSSHAASHAAFNAASTPQRSLASCSLCAANSKQEL